MKKFVQIVLVAAFVVAVCSADAPRFRSGKLANRRRLFARQEEDSAVAAPTPYPAAGFKPEVPFELPTKQATPDQTYGPPDQTYGPPDQIYGPPDQTYGPPEIDDLPRGNQLPAENKPEKFFPEQPEQSDQPEESINPLAEEFAPEESTDEPQAERLVIRHRGRKQSVLSRQRIAPAKLQLRQTSQRFQPIISAQPPQFFAVNQPFAYSAQFQSW